MNNIKKFENFLESLKGKGQDKLIESIHKGFQAIYETHQYHGSPLQLGHMFGIDDQEMTNLSQIELDTNIEALTDLRNNPKYIKVISAGKTVSQNPDEPSIMLLHFTISEDMVRNYMTSDDPEELENVMKHNAYSDQGPGRPFTQVSSVKVDKHDDYYSVVASLRHGLDI